MKKIRCLIFALLTLTAISFNTLTGCSSNVILEQQTETSLAEEFDSDIDSWKSGTNVIGTVSHGIRKEDAKGLTENGYLTCDGGECTVPYRCSVSGEATNIGFLLFVNGQPQSYHTSETAEDTYCHVLELEEDVEKDFDFTFSPSAGKAGDTLELTILSVYNPNFMPDMVQTSSYGMYHQTLEINCTIKLETAPPSNAAQTITDNAVESISTTEADLTSDYLSGPISLNYGMQELTQESLDDNIYNVVLFDKTYITDNYAINSGSHSITLEMCGKDGTEYSVTPFINHKPIGAAQSVVVKKGKISSLTVTLNADALENLQTFYFIAIPTDHENFFHIKTSSILLYRGNADSANSDGTEYNSENSSTSLSNTAFINEKLFEGGIEDLYYAGEDQLLVYANDFYLYDMEKAAVIAKYFVNEGRVVERKFFRTTDGYAIIGTIYGDSAAADGRSVKCWLFDQNFTCIKTIDLIKPLSKKSDPYLLAAAVSADGKNIAIAGNNALYLYNYANNTIDRLFAYTHTKYADELLVNEVYFTGQDEKIVFTATAFDESTSANTPVYGLVSIDGSDLVCHTASDYTLTDEIIVQPDELWFPEAFDNATGKLLVTNTNGQRVRTINLEGKDTGADGIFGSTDGKYIATIKWQDKQTGWKVRIYDAANGKIVHEELCKLTQKNYSAIACKVRILDEQRKCIVIAGKEQETQLFYFSF